MAAVPQEVLDYFTRYNPRLDRNSGQFDQNLWGGGQANAYTDSTGRKWYGQNNSVGGGAGDSSDGSGGYVAPGFQQFDGFRTNANGLDFGELDKSSDNYYDTSGNYTHQAANEGLGSIGKDLAMFVAIAASMGTLGPMLAGANAAGAGAGAGMAGAGVAGDAMMPGLLGAGGSEVAFGSLIPGLEAYALPAAAGAGAGGLTGASAGGGNGAFLGEAAWTPTAGGGAMPGGFEALGAGGAGAGGAGGAGSSAATAGTTAATTAAPAAGGGLLSSLGGAGSTLLKAGSWLAPLLGGALGSQPTTTDQNVTKRMDPRMDALVYGDGGFLNNATDWYSQNKSGMNDAMRSALAQNRGLLNDPATRQGYQTMANTGQGLLGQPVAANPYAAGRPTGPSLFEQYARPQGGFGGQRQQVPAMPRLNSPQQPAQFEWGSEYLAPGGWGGPGRSLI